MKWNKADCEHLLKIKNEIDRVRVELDDAVNDCKNCTYINAQRLTGMPFGSGTSDRTSQTALREIYKDEKVKAIKDKYDMLYVEYFMNVQSLKEHAKTLEPRTALILELKYIHGKSESDIAKLILIRKYRVVEKLKKYFDTKA